MMGLRLSEKILCVVAVVAAVNVVALCIAYALYPGYIDTGEPNIVALAWRLLDGNSVYHPIDDATRITNLYGPYLYLIHALVFSVFGASVAIGKAPGLIALIIALVIMAVSQRDRGWASVSFAVSGFAAIVVLNLPASIWDRPETFMLMSVALGVWLNNRSALDQRWLRAAVFGVLIGFVIGQKVFAAIYFLPFGFLMLYQDGIIACIVTVVIAFSVAALPFMTPLFEFKYLVDLIQLMADKPNSWDGLKKVMRYAAIYVVPASIFIAFGWQSMSRNERTEVSILSAGVVLAMALVLYPAQKPGAGMYYLLPFAPIAMDLAGRGLCAMRTNHKLAIAASLAVAVLMNVVSVPVEKRFVRSLNWQMASAVAEEIAQISKDFKGQKIEIGIGSSNDSYRRTYQRTRLVFAGHPYSLDTSIIIDTTAWGIELSQATLNMIETCQTDIWLIPVGERPYAWYGYYGKDTYGQPFRDSFTRAFQKTESRTYFDIYRCRAPR
jgi:hypothetical protein